MQCDVADARLVGYRCWYVVAGARPPADGPRAGGGGHAAPWPGALAPALAERPTQRRDNWTIPVAVSFPHYTPEEPASKSYSTFHCSYVRFERFEGLVRLNSLWMFDLYDFFCFPKRVCEWNQLATACFGCLRRYCMAFIIIAVIDKCIINTHTI